MRVTIVLIAGAVCLIIAGLGARVGYQTQHHGSGAPPEYFRLLKVIYMFFFTLAVALAIAGIAAIFLVRT